MRGRAVSVTCMQPVMRVLTGLVTRLLTMLSGLMKILVHRGQWVQGVLPLLLPLPACLWIRPPFLPLPPPRAAFRRLYCLAGHMHHLEPACRLGGRGGCGGLRVPRPEELQAALRIGLLRPRIVLLLLPACLLLVSSHPLLVLLRVDIPRFVLEEFQRHRIMSEPGRMTIDTGTI